MKQKRLLTHRLTHLVELVYSAKDKIRHQSSYETIRLELLFSLRVGSLSLYIYNIHLVFIIIVFFITFRFISIEIVKEKVDQQRILGVPTQGKLCSSGT